MPTHRVGGGEDSEGLWPCFRQISRLGLTKAGFAAPQLEKRPDRGCIGGAFFAPLSLAIMSHPCRM